MMGARHEAQAALFYEFSLEDDVPGDHMLRLIDQFVDLSSVRSLLAPFYSSTGRPSIDPELMIRMLLVGYCMGIRSERRLCEEVHLNLAYRWFCRLDLSTPVPDHSTFSKHVLGLRPGGTGMVASRRAVCSVTCSIRCWRGVSRKGWSGATTSVPMPRLSKPRPAATTRSSGPTGRCRRS